MEPVNYPNKVAAHRARRREMGFVRIELEVLVEDVDAVRKYVAKRTKATIKNSGKPMVARIYGAFSEPAND